MPYSNESYGWTAPLGTYYPAQEISQSMHNVISQYEQHNWQCTANVSSCASQSSQASYAPADFTPVNDPVAQVLQSERRKGRGDKMATPTVIEIKQAELTGGKVREDQLRSTGIAFGPSYQVKSIAFLQVSGLGHYNVLLYRLVTYFLSNYLDTF